MLAAVTVLALPAAAESTPARTGQVGQLSAAQQAAAPIVDGVPFLIRFAGTVRGLKPGAAVEVQGIRIGDVRSVGLEYAPDKTMQSTNRLIDRTGQTFATIDRQVGDRSPLLADIRGLVQEMQGAARSMRLLAEYLERNPTR